jgi:hypothetical protein
MVAVATHIHNQSTTAILSKNVEFFLHVLFALEHLIANLQLSSTFANCTSRSDNGFSNISRAASASSIKCTASAKSFFSCLFSFSNSS